MLTTDTRLTYHTPVLVAVIPDWPSGSHKVTARFAVEMTKHGERVARITQHPIKGTWSLPKRTTYARKARICTGSDGRTYILELGLISGSITVMQWNLQYQQEFIPTTDPRYADLIALFN